MRSNNEIVDPNQESWENLANAIVLSAVKDFRRSYRKYLKDPENRDVADEVAALIRFFDSDYYCLLTSLDGATLVRKLKKEVEEKVNAEKKKKEKRSANIRNTV